MESKAAQEQGKPAHTECVLPLMVLHQPGGKWSDFSSQCKMGGTVTKCQKPAEPASAGLVLRSHPLVRRARHCTGDYTRQQSWGLLESCSAARASHSSVLTSVCLCNTTCSETVSSRRQEPSKSGFKTKTSFSSQRSSAQGLGMLRPSSGHAACDKDLGLTLGRFILNNLFAPVCRAGTSAGPAHVVPAVGAASPTCPGAAGKDLSAFPVRPKTAYCFHRIPEFHRIPSHSTPCNGQTPSTVPVQPGLSSPDINHKVRLLHPCLADGSCSLTKLITKPNSQQFTADGWNPGLLLSLITEQSLQVCYLQLPGHGDRACSMET